MLYSSAVSAIQSMFAPGLFAGQVCVVTGGGSGIGLETAKQLRALGAAVAICGRNEEKLAAGRAEIDAAPGSGAVLAARCDIREPDQVQAFVERVCAELGKID